MKHVPLLVIAFLKKDPRHTQSFIEDMIYLKPKEKKTELLTRVLEQLRKKINKPHIHFDKIILIYNGGSTRKFGGMTFPPRIYTYWSADQGHL